MLKILLGGIPLGCDNIGDEAILAAVCRIMRRNFPGCRLTVCTAAPESTAALLQVETAPLYGFNPELSLRAFRGLLKEHHLYVWAGATGLSDYPLQALKLLECAQQAGLPNIVWGVGMNDTLNPYLFRLQPGRRRQCLNLCSWLSARRLDCVQLYERHLEQKTRTRIARVLAKCPLVVVRDPGSARELERCGFMGARVGADSAILQESALSSPLPLSPGVQTIGLCVSAQRALQNQDEFVHILDQLLLPEGRRLVFIPMNPKTDAALMADMQARLRFAGKTLLLQNCLQPDLVQAAAASCNVIVSSRLHLLILAANVGVPMIGISRGSKVDQFLAEFDQLPVGDVDHCQFQKLAEKVEFFLQDGKQEAFRQQAAEVQDRLLTRLREAEQFLQAFGKEIQASG